MSARTLRTSAKQPEKPQWTGSGRRHAGRVSQKRGPPQRAGRAGGGRVAHGGASSGVPGSQGMPQKRTFPGSLWKYLPKETGERFFWAAWFQNPNFAGAAPCASPGSFKGFMRTMPPVRWGAAMEVAFLLGPSWTTPPALRATSPYTGEARRARGRTFRRNAAPTEVIKQKWCLYRCSPSHGRHGSHEPFE